MDQNNMPLDDNKDFWHHTDDNRNRVYKFRVNVVNLWRRIWGPRKSENEDKLKQIKAEQADWESPNSPSKDLLKNDLIERLCKELKMRDTGEE